MVASLLLLKTLRKLDSCPQRCPARPLLSPEEAALGPVDFPFSPCMAFFVVSPLFSETTVLLFPAVAELGPVDFPLLPCIVLFVASLPSEEACCATAPAHGAASRLAANTIDREIEVITTSFPALSAAYAAILDQTSESPRCSVFRNAAHAESTY